MAAKAASKSSRPPSRTASRPKSVSKPKAPTRSRATPKKPKTTPKRPVDKGLKSGTASKLSKEEGPRNLPNLSWASDSGNVQQAKAKKEEGPKLPTEAIPGPPKRPQIGEHDRNRASQILAPYEAEHAQWKEKYGESYDAVQSELKKLPPRPEAPQYDIYARRQSDAEQAQYQRELQAWNAKHGERYKHLNSLIQ